MNDRNPYADDGGYDDLAGPERTSALAVLSLILSLVCCIPGLGILGAGLGVGAMIGIGGSRGRVGGKGLAIAGIIVGILVSVAWIGGYVFFQATMGQILSRTGAIAEALDTGDYGSFRTMTLSPASELSDEDYDAFVAEYQSQLGSYDAVPESVFEWIGNFGDPTIGQAMQGLALPPGALPLTAYFDNRTTAVILVPAAGGDPSIPTDMIYLLPDGSTVTLSDYLGVGGSAGDGSDASADDAADDGSDADDPDGP